MKKKKFILPIVLSYLMLSISLAVWSSTPAAGVNALPDGPPAPGFITEYAIPTADGQPQRLAIEAAGPPARLWFTMPGADALGHLVVTSTVDYALTTVAVMTDSEPYDLVYDAAANVVWFTEPGTSQIGRLAVATGVVTEIPVLGGHSPSGIDVAPDGRVWFTEPAANQLVVYDPMTQAFTEFVYPFADGEPDEIAILNSDSIWITAVGANRVSELTPSTATYTHIPVSDFGIPPFPPSGLALDNNGPWVSAATMNRIGRYAPGTLALWRWYIVHPPDSSIGDSQIVYREMGGIKHIWYTKPARAQVGLLLLSTNGNVVGGGSYAVSSATDIAVDANGQAWITGQDSQVISQWSPPYFYFIHLPIIFTTS